MLQRYPPWAPPIAAGPGGDAAEALPRPPPAPVGMLQRYPPWAPPIAAGTGGDVAEVPALGTADRRRHRWRCCRGTRPGHRRSPPAPVGMLQRRPPRPVPAPAPAPAGTLQPTLRRHPAVRILPLG